MTDEERRALREEFERAWDGLSEEKRHKARSIARMLQLATTAGMKDQVVRLRGELESLLGMNLAESS